MNRPLLLLAIASLVVPAAAGAATSWSVDIQNNAFSPRILAAQSGDDVTWTNQDSFAHTVTCDEGCTFGSPNLGNGDTFTTTLAGAGTQKYYCAVHPSMRGELHVGSGDAADADLRPDASTLDASRGTTTLLGLTVPNPTKVILSVEVENLGGSASPAVAVEFRSVDSTGAEVVIAFGGVPAIPAGGRATATAEWSNAPLTGNEDVIVVVDPANDVVEGVETNNRGAGSVTLSLL